MSDPVADKSGFLCMYMSSHPDTLVSYAKHFGHISESLLSAKMESIDSKGMNLSYVTKKDGPNYKGEKKVVRVLFEPPLSGYEEVKPRLLGMKADADEALGTVRIFYPLFTHFFLHFVSQLCERLILMLRYLHTGQSPPNHILRPPHKSLPNSLPPRSPRLHHLGPILRLI